MSLQNQRTIFQIAIARINSILLEIRNNLGERERGRAKEGGRGRERERGRGGREGGRGEREPDLDTHEVTISPVILPLTETMANLCRDTRQLSNGLSSTVTYP